MNRVLRRPVRYARRVGRALGRAARYAGFSAYYAATALNYALETHPPKKRVPGGSFRNFELLNLHGRDPLLRQLLATLAPGETVWDVGAHTGVYALAAATVSSSVVAIEPNPAVCERLRANVRTNEFGERIVVREVGLGERSGRRPFYRSSYPELGSFNRYNASRWEAAVRGTISVPVRTADALVDDLPPPDHLKIDVEGFGLEVLSGARETIERHRPAVYFEPHPTGTGSRESELRAFFDARDYRIEPCADAWCCTPVEW
jgi:FkbM family methyltransferase